MVDLPEQVRRQLVRLLSERPEVAQAILFGSRARGDAAPRSDIDLAIVAPTATTRQWLDLTFLLEEEADTLLPIDVVRWEEATSALKEKIATQGEIIYDRETKPELG